ncbi:MAG: YrzE family protein, partial [Candidatus Omnitrophica bacterium]|nr:YrzE family protein [Candidatus Omnitrophota bacterium]
MFRYFNKIFNKILKIPRKALSRKEGQVAVILILIVAAALIFYAASLNLSRVSQLKTITTIAADTAASTLGSFMASYGHQVQMTSLGGVTKKCGLTGVVGSVISLIVAIIAVVVTIITCVASGACQGAWLFAVYVAIIALVLAVASLVLQLAYVQPGMTEKWNAYIFKMMSPADAFVELGIQTALGASVTDQATVADVNDSDQDRIFGFDINGAPLDKVSRFGFYYEKRLGLIPVRVSGQTADFLNALRNFSLDNGDGWGLLDDTGPVCTTSAPSECNRCCISPAYWTAVMGCAADVSTDPSVYVPDPAGVASMQATCAAGSPYGSSYPWVYDKYHGNATNTFVSFQEQLGRDDEHQLFEKNPADPNGIQISVLPPPPPLPPTNFQLKDTTGFYTPTVYPPADNRTGVYPLFYKIADWKVNLDLGAEPFDLTAKPNQCHWCDQRETSVGGCPANQPLEIPQLVLDPGSPPSGAVYNTTLCVDGTNLVSGNPPLAVDRVRLPDASTGLIEAAPAQCAQSADATATGRQIGFWKRGGDRFCSATSPPSWPYYGNCPKEGVSPPEDGRACGDADSLSPENWPDDLVDDLVYGL